MLIKSYIYAVKEIFGEKKGCCCGWVAPATCTKIPTPSYEEKISWVGGWK